MLDKKEQNNKKFLYNFLYDIKYDHYYYSDSEIFNSLYSNNDGKKSIYEAYLNPLFKIYERYKRDSHNAYKVKEFNSILDKIEEICSSSNLLEEENKTKLIMTLTKKIHNFIFMMIVNTVYSVIFDHIRNNGCSYNADIKKLNCYVIEYSKNIYYKLSFENEAIDIIHKILIEITSYDICTNKKEINLFIKKLSNNYSYEITINNFNDELDNLLKSIKKDNDTLIRSRVIF